MEHWLLRWNYSQNQPFNDQHSKCSVFGFLSVFSPNWKVLLLLLFSVLVFKTSFYCQTCTQGFKEVGYVRDRRQGWEARLSRGTDLYLLHKKQKAAQWGDGASRGWFTALVSPTGRLTQEEEPQWQSMEGWQQQWSDRKRPQWKQGTMAFFLSTTFI